MLVIELVKELFFLFALETGILGVVKENEDFLAIILLIIGVLACFFGFKIYRAIFSVLVFMAVTLISIFLMAGKTDWGTITTTFAVLGTVLAFFAYRWHWLGGFIICALVAIATGWIHTYSLWFSLMLGILVIASMAYVPVIMICLMTSLWGAIIIYEFLINYLIIDNGGFIVSIIIMIGFILQMLSNKEQSLFEKIYQPRFIYLIKRIGKRYENSV